MATIDPNIAMGYKPVQIENPLNQLAAMTQIQTGQQGQQLNALKIQEAERELNENKDIRNYLTSANLKTPEGRAGLRQFGKTGLAYEKLITDQEKADLERKEISGKISKQEMDRNNQNLRNLSRNPSNANIQAYFEDFVLDNPNEAQKIANAQRTRDYLLSADIPTRNAYLSSIGATASDLKPTIKDTDIGGSILPRVLDPYSGLPISTGKPIAKTATPGELLTDARARERLAAELQSTGTLTPAAIDVAAQIYIQTGQLPALGIGKNAGNLKSSILNRATELYNNPAGAAPSVNPPGAAPNVNPPGVAPNVNAPAGANVSAPFNASNMAEQIIGNKMDVAAKSKAVRDFASGPESRKITAFNTAINHLDTLSKLSVALQNNDVQAINYIGNAFAKATGQPAPTTFDAAKSIIGSEIAKAVSGAGATALGDRKEIREAIESKNSPAQLAEVINGFTELLGGQLDSMQHTYKSSTGRTDFNTKLTPRAREVVSKLSANATASPTTVTTLDGKTYTFPTLEAADKFKQAAGIK